MWYKRGNLTQPGEKQWVVKEEPYWEEAARCLGYDCATWELGVDVELMR